MIMLKKWVSEEKGSVMVIVALSLTVLIGFTAMVTDAGLFYLTKFNLANGVDAAALSGAQDLPYNPINALETAGEYAALNGLSSSETNIEIFNNDRSIKVTGEKDVKFFFAKVLGFDTGSVKHEAIAQVAPISGVKGAAPLGIQAHNFEFGQEYTLKVGAGDTSSLSEETSPGWFGALALGGPGASNYEDNLTYGYAEPLELGDTIDIQTGNISGPTERAIDYRIAEDKHTPYCTVDSFERDCSRLVKIPVIEPVDNHTVKIIGFAMFLVDEVTGQGNDSVVTGKFVKTVDSGEVSQDASDFGLVGVRLIK